MNSLNPPGRGDGGSHLVSTCVGPGGKDSLVNTVDDDILEYILNKLRTKEEAKAKTFLIKVKAHRGEPVTERTDDLVDKGRTLTKNSREGIPVERQSDTFGILVLRHDLESIGKKHLEQNDSQ